MTRSTADLRLIPLVLLLLLGSTLPLAADCEATVPGGVLIGQEETQETIPTVDPSGWWGRIRKISYWGYYDFGTRIVRLYCHGAIRPI